jgi:transaldolase/glucose-6-phosphate isomerase
MNRLLDVAAQGQSLWFDYIQRGLLWSGELQRMVREDGLRGLTSNPAIFEKAIGHTKDYLPAVRALARQGLGAEAIFERLAIEDLQHAADVLLPVYQSTAKLDGYVSLEVSPHLAHDGETTLAEARRLWRAVDRENLMIKVPATPAGIPAIEALIADGINVNVTLLFSVDAYRAVAEAFLRGLEARAARGLQVSGIGSVASFFVSRIDTLVDQQLDAAGHAAPEVRGRVAIANAKRAYRHFQGLVASPRWAALAAGGAMPQRLLWASTGTKNKAYRDTVYVEELIGPHTVNTVPEATWHATKDHGVAEPRLLSRQVEDEAALEKLAGYGVSLDAVTTALLDDGVVKFADAFDALMSAVERRRVEVLGDAIAPTRFVGVDEKAEATQLEALRTAGFTRRLWKKDATLFGGAQAYEPASSGYMAWLDVAERTRAQLPAMVALREAWRADGVTTVVLMGMGGSSLAPDVFAKVFGRADGGFALEVLDSTVPAQLAALEARLDLAKTAFIVSSKSGTTSEPLAFDAYFFDRVRDGRRFAAVTDPGSKLEGMAKERGFRAIFAGEPEVGGRYSALSAFGIVAAVMLGHDAGALLDRAAHLARSSGPAIPPRDNPGVRLGALLGRLAAGGRDKLTVVTSSTLAPFGAWLEQLVAESTGKHGKGIVPVDLEPLEGPDAYGADRVFAVLTLAGDDTTALEAKLALLGAAGHPIVHTALASRFDLVAEMYRWAIATATAGSVLGINPFDQPNVQESKDFTKRFLDAFVATGKLPPIDGEAQLTEGHGLRLFAPTALADKLGTGSVEDVLARFMGLVGAGDYVAVNAYVDMNDELTAALQSIRTQLFRTKGVATTLGFGPRFLHSTGQIHKGGANNGVFLMLTTDPEPKLPIPGAPYGFAELVTAQANGDFLALASRGRRVLRVHLGADVRHGLKHLAMAMGMGRNR